MRRFLLTLILVVVTCLGCSAGGNVSAPDTIQSGDIDPDAMLDADECDFHAVWATLDGDNYDIARRNGVLVAD